jgi:DNA-binding response OmpR family regulator
VEDDSSIRFALADMLTDEGFDVTTVVNGRTRSTSSARPRRPTSSCWT